MRLSQIGLRSSQTIRPTDHYRASRLRYRTLRVSAPPLFSFAAMTPFLAALASFVHRSARRFARTVTAVAFLCVALGLPMARAQIYVADGSLNGGAGGVSVFAQGADGDVLPDMILAGPGTGFTLPLAVVASPTHLYALFNTFVEPPFVLKFNLPTAGNAAPVSKTYLAPAAGEFGFVNALAIDGTNLYLLDNGTGIIPDLGAVNVYPLSSLTSNTAISPLAATRTVTGTATLLNRPSGLAVDGTAIYVANSLGNDVLIFALAATGNAAPTRRIAGASTTLNGPASVAVDAARMYVLNALSSRVTTYALGASGDVAPASTVGSSSLTPGALLVAVYATHQ